MGSTPLHAGVKLERNNGWVTLEFLEPDDNLDFKSVSAVPDGAEKSRLAAETLNRSCR